MTRGLGRASFLTFFFNIAIDAVILAYSFVFTAFSIFFMLAAGPVLETTPSGPIHDALTSLIYLLMIPFVLLAIMESVGCLLGIGLGLLGMFEPIWRKPFPLWNSLLSLAGLVANVAVLGFDLLFAALIMAFSL